MHLSKLISFEIKTRILLFLQKFKKDDYFSSLKNNRNKKVFIFLAADYGNLGDVAITYAQSQFLKEKLPNYNVIDVPISKTLEGITSIKRIIQREDLITIVGGGNLGDLYNQIEFYRQLVVEKFPKNKIISFPQTIDFQKPDNGKKALLKAQKKYGKHHDLNFVAREKQSFELMKQVFFKNQVVLTPDIVLSINKTEPEFQRKGVILCLRGDAEKLLTNQDHTILLELVGKKFGSYTNYDTHIGVNYLSLKEREVELDKIWTAFKNAELVITDRLHGMIFCYITNTPCIVFKNNNHKIKGSYEWIKKKNNIKLIEKFSNEEISSFFENMNYKNMRPISLNDDFKELERIINCL